MPEPARAGARPSTKIDEFARISFAAEGGEFAAGEHDAAARRMLSIGDQPLNQKVVPCCVAVALTTAMRFVGGTARLAPLFNYYLSRTKPAVLDDVEIADAFRSAMNDGVCTATLHSFPFDAASAVKAPSNAALTDGLGRTLMSFGPIDVLETEWKGAIDRSLPVLIGFFMSPEYEDIRNGATLVHDAPTAKGNGHATLVIGYDDATQEFTVRDSRGPGIGVAGTWQLPYARLNDDFIFESWVITAVP